MMHAATKSEASSSRCRIVEAQHAGIIASTNVIGDENLQLGIKWPQ